VACACVRRTSWEEEGPTRHAAHVRARLCGPADLLRRSLRHPVALPPSSPHRLPLPVFRRGHFRPGLSPFHPPRLRRPGCGSHQRYPHRHSHLPHPPMPSDAVSLPLPVLRTQLRAAAAREVKPPWKALPLGALGRPQPPASNGESCTDTGCPPTCRHAARGAVTLMRRRGRRAMAGLEDETTQRQVEAAGPRERTAWRWEKAC